MQTLREAIERLEKSGYVESFHVEGEGRLEASNGRSFEPDQLQVDEMLRFEGESDPADLSILFALRSADGKARGTFVAPYGPTNVDPATARVLQRLGTPRDPS